MHPYARAAGYGFATGLRTMTAPVALGSKQRTFGRLLLLAAIGEVVADKLPITPSRLSAPPLMGRMIVGGYAGWRIARDDVSPVIAALCGVAAAAGGAAIGYSTRRFVVKRLRTPDIVAALAEDALAIVIVAYLSRWKK